MSKKRLFYLYLVLGLVVLVAIAAYASIGSLKVVSAASFGPQAIQANTGACPFTEGELRSLHSVNIKDTHTSILETSDGPIGLDGGTLALSRCKISK